MMEINNKAIRFQVDSGASINVITQDLIGDCTVKPTNTKLLMWNKSEVNALGSVRLIILKTRRNIPLIGAKATQHMKLLTVHKENFMPVPPPNKPLPSVKHVTSATK